MCAFVMSLPRVCAAFFWAGQVITPLLTAEPDPQGSVPPYPGDLFLSRRPKVFI